MVCVPSVSSPNPAVDVFPRILTGSPVNHLGVHLHVETRVLILQCFHVEVDFWDGRDHFAKLQLLLHLLFICIRSWMLWDWLAAPFLCSVSPRTSPCVGRSPLVRFACCWLCSCLACRWLCSCLAVDFALLGSFQHCSRSSMFFSRSPRTRVALLQSPLLFTTGSLVVVPSLFFFLLASPAFALLW